MLSISEFSEMCQLPPQTLRFYHAEELLVPAEVEERNGYRWYRFDQVERAMMISVLRGTGMSVETVRQALAEPDVAPRLLGQHVEDVRRQRTAQDAAIADAREFLESWPEVRRTQVPQVTVLSKLVEGPSVTNGEYDWQQVDIAVNAVVDELVRIAESRGIAAPGKPWRAWATEKPQQKQATVTSEGPHWLVKVPVQASLGAQRTPGGQVLADLPEDVEVQVIAAREELSIFVPGRTSMAKYATALSRLLTHPLDDAYIDVSRMRWVLHEGGVENAAAIRNLTGDE